MFNGVVAVDLANFVNNSHVLEVTTSPQLLEDPRFTYFLNREIIIKNFAPKNITEAIKNIENNQMTIFIPNENKELANQLYAFGKSQSDGIEMQSLLDPLNLIEALMFIKLY